MPFRASPPRKVGAWTKETLTDAESVPSAAADFVNLEQSTVTMSGGFGTPVFAILPDKHHYDKIRFSFGAPTLDAVTAATMAVYALHADGSVSLVGTSELAANGTFPAIETENYQARYAVILQALTGTELTAMDVFVQGLHEGYVTS